MIEPLGQGSVDPLSKRFDAALVDLDGVLYVGRSAVEGAPEAVQAARRAGMRVAFVTNNASRTPEVVAEHLTELGIAAVAADVVTSAQAAATLVAELVPPGSRVLVVGGAGLEEALKERGLRPVWSADDEPDAVVQGFAPDVGWRQLTEGALAVRAGLPWVASNLDLTVPTPRGPAPGNGTLVGVVARATGSFPLAAGKPELPLHREAVRRTGSERPLVVGDRLDTDIEGGNRAGVPTLLVLTGITTPLDVVMAEPSHRPTWVAETLPDGLLRPHPPVVRRGGTWSCGGWDCRLGDGVIHVAGAGPRIDALRALSVAAWSTGAPLTRHAVAVLDGRPLPSVAG
ncbi:HAD-IIA family hydrolase [Oryzobacter sp. R7]|uniref:HAD-IIA family hydrolase n=1 Tax=Oryzobacter faecalis TaxID=3388656 RepID=UPI00398CA7AB